MSKKNIAINKTNVTRHIFWQALKNYNVVFRLKKWSFVKVWYNIPYGGGTDGSNYNLYSIDYKK